MRTSLKCTATKHCAKSCNKIQRNIKKVIVPKVIVPKVVSNALSLSIDDDMLASVVSEIGSYAARNHRVIKKKPRYIVSSKLIKSIAISLMITILNDHVLVHEYDHWITHVIKTVMMIL